MMKRLCVAIFFWTAPTVSATALEPIPASCTESAGEAFGRSGEAYRGGCPPETERDFLSGYILGRRVLSAEIGRERAQREYEEAGRHSATAIEFHSNKADEALVKIASPQLNEKKRAAARQILKIHREQILLIEEEFDWKSDRLWDAYLHLEQVKAELADWRKSEEHDFGLALFTEGQAFARNEAAVEYCSDKTETTFFSPRLFCEVRDGSVLVDMVTGKVCVTGPSRATLLRRGLWGDELEPAAAFLHSFNVSRRGENGAMKPLRGFLALFDEDGVYLGVRCPEPEEWN